MTQERSTRVILCPNSTDRHIILLGRHLEKIGARVSYFEWFGGFAPYWMAKLALLRIQGNRVLSVHWTPFDSWTRMRIARILCRALGIKMVLTVHNLVPHDVRFGSESKDKEAMLFLSEWSDAIVVHSDVTKRDVENLYGQTEDKISVIPLASYTEMIKISENPDRARERLGLPMNKVLVFMLSPCRKDKGLNTYLTCVRFFPSSHVGVLSGRCEDPELRRLAEECAQECPGKLILDFRRLSEEELADYYAATDIFFIPYNVNTTSGTVMEAISYGKSVIAPPMGNIPMLVEDGRNGYLASNVSEMVARIGSISREMAHDMGNESLRIAARTSWESTAREYLTVFERVTGR